MSESETVLTVYTPNDRSGGILRTAVQSVSDVYTTRYLIWRLFVRDFKGRFRQSVLGYAWALITPLFSVVSFIILKYAGILNPGPINVPYPVYAFVGTSVWSFLIGTVISVSGGLRAQSDLIMRTNIPKIALAAASLANVFYGIATNLVTIVLLMAAFGVPLHWSSLAFPILILPLVILGTGIGLIVSVIGIIAKDLTPFVTQMLSFLMYVTPVVFVSDQVQNRILHEIIVANPLTYLIEFPRSILLGESSPYLLEYLGCSGLTAIALLLGLKVFDVIKDLVAERL